MSETEIAKRIEELEGDRFLHASEPTRWAEKMGRSLKDMMKEGVQTYDWVTEKALKLYEEEDKNGNNTNTLRKLLDTLAKVTSLKISACMEIMKITADIGKDERTMQEKIDLIKGVIESPFAQVVLKRAEQMEKKGKLKDDGDDE